MGTRAPTGSRSVFVGNIPYEMSEEQLSEVFTEAGPVVSFRLMFDRDTGKPRGYGFCEFQDAETAASAVRNLNNHDVGGRQLRVDYADNNPGTAPPAAGGPPAGPLPTGGAAGMNRPDDRGDFRDFARRDGARKSPPRELAPPNRGHPAQAGPFNGGTPASNQPPPNPKAAQQAIENTLGMMNPNQLFDLMVQMKSFVAQSPEQAHLLLSQNAQLSYALFQALLMMNLVDPNLLQRIMQTSPGLPLPPPNLSHQQKPNPPLPPHNQGHPHSSFMDMGGQPPYNSTHPSSLNAGGYAGAPKAPATMTGGHAPHMNSGPSHPPQQQQVPTHPAQQHPPRPAPAQPSAMSIEEQQKQLLLQVLNLTPEQINSLPPDQRASVHALKQQILLGQGGP